MEISPAPSSALQQLRRVRRTRAQYEKLQRPDDIQPGSPIPSIEGWVLFFSNLPETTNPEDIQNFLVSFREGDPEYFGPVTDVKIPLNADCYCAGYALVELKDRTGYERALAELNGTAFPSAEAPLLVAPTFLAEEEEAEEAEDGEGAEAPGEKRTRDGADEEEGGESRAAQHMKEDDAKEEVEGDVRAER